MATFQLILQSVRANDLSTPLYETKRFITHSQAPNNCPYTVPDQSIPCTAFPLLNNPLLFLSFLLRLGLPGGLFLSSLPTRTMYATYNATCHAHDILDLITRITFGE